MDCRVNGGYLPVLADALIDYSVSWASENHDHMLERWSALMEQEAGR